MEGQITRFPDGPTHVVGGPQTLGLGDVAALFLGLVLMAVAIFWPRRAS